jgi:hypothetical protein
MTYSAFIIGTMQWRHVYHDCCITILRADSAGWAMFPGGSQNGSRYTIIDKATTFYGGQERCQKLGGYLVHINSLREQLFVEDFILQELERQQRKSRSETCVL